MALVDVDYTTEGAGDVVEQLLDHFDAHVESGEARGERAAQVMDAVSGRPKAT